VRSGYQKSPAPHKLWHDLHLSCFTCASKTFASNHCCVHISLVCIKLAQRVDGRKGGACTAFTHTLIDYHKQEHACDVQQTHHTGAFGVVYKAKDRETGLEFCCKSIRKELLTAEVFDDIK